MDYDYEQMKEKIREEQNKVESFEIVEEIQSNNVQEIQEIDNKEENIEKSWEYKQNESQNEDNVLNQSQNENNIEESWNVDLQKSEEISEEEIQKKKEMKKIFINF